MPLDPTTPINNDRYDQYDHHDELPRPGAPERAGARDAITDSGEEPIRTLLWTAATHRPLEEVAALVMLLKRTGEVPNPGDEALRVAAVARPVDEVMQLVAMLNEPPHEIDEADTTLRAAAVGRPIEEVAQLVSYLGTHENEPPFATAHRRPARREPNREEPKREEPKGEPENEVPENEPNREEPAPTLFRLPDEHGRRDAYDPRDPRSLHDLRDARDSRDPRDVSARLAEHADQAAHVARPPEPEIEPEAARDREPDPEPERVAPWTSAPAGPPPEVPRLAPAADRRPAARPGARTVTTALRSPLRWPAAAALLACGVIHLPTDFAGMRSGGYADAVSLVVTLLCLVFGLWLAVADSARIWAASAATAVGIIAAHTLSSLGTVDLLRSSLGADFAWASLVAVGCAAVTLALAGTALTVRQKTVRKTARGTGRQTPRRSSPASGAINDA
ncbi:hypothetical protein [Streptomyces sp. NBC_01506]|uniref:hypothetical protein n=1 Tax=Streptomyces sp. NBC_01506 TaxID=2903887 RepID=UPI00386524FC